MFTFKPFASPFVLTVWGNISLCTSRFVLKGAGKAVRSSVFILPFEHIQDSFKEISESFYT